VHNLRARERLDLRTLLLTVAQSVKE